MSKLTQSDLPVIVARGDSYARVYRIEGAPSDIGYDLGTGATLETFVPTSTGQGVPPIPGFNAEDAETWPTVAELEAHFTAVEAAAQTAMLAEVQKAYDDATEKLLNERAASWGYTSMSRATTYYASTNAKWAAEAAALIAHRDEVWEAGQAIANDVIAGLRAVPSLAEYIAELPALPTRPTV
jgi:phytoene dehydrogenase-like protein